MVERTVSAQRQAQENGLRETARALALVVDREITQRATVARVLADSLAAQGGPAWRADTHQPLTVLAQSAMTSLDGWIEIVSDSRVLLNTYSAGAELTASAAFATAASAPPGDMPYVDALRQQADGTWRAAVVQPVADPQGARTLLAVTLRASELQGVIDRQEIPEGWVATILDNRQQVVARHPGGGAFTGRPATPDMRARVKAADEGLFESVTLDGKSVVGYYSTSPQGWVYITAMPQAEFGGYLQESALKVALAALALIALAMAGAVWVSRGIERNVMALKTGAGHMQRGHPVARQTLAIAECDEVAQALAAAAEAASRARADLEQQVARAVEETRTAEQRTSQGLRMEALGRLTGGMAHDFNNLLGVISNSAHLAQRYIAERPELKFPVEATLRAVAVGSRLTQHLTRFAGQRPVRPQPVSLQRYLPDFEDMLASVVGKRIAVQVEVDAGTPSIRVDSSELELALINLALNARDALPAGGCVRLLARPAHEAEKTELAPGEYALISFSDDGVGIEPPVAERVFEPFFTTKPTGKGTGLGLSQVHGFCQQAGGRATLSSPAGGGTTVGLVLPGIGNTVSAGDAAVAAPGATAAAPSPDHALKGLSVLMVEDNEALGDVTAALLQACGASARRALDPASALAMLHTGALPDVVLTDIVMPGPMDGIALAREIRVRHPGLPVVLISGYTSEVPPPTEFILLAKPCGQDELVRALWSSVRRLP